MFFPTHHVIIHIALGSTDMRKSIDGLSTLVSENLNLVPFFITATGRSGLSLTRLAHNKE